MATAMMNRSPAYQKRSKVLGITVRHLQFYPEKIKRHYFANSAVMSYLCF